MYILNLLVETEDHFKVFTGNLSMHSISTIKKSILRLLSTTAAGAVVTTGLVASGFATPATAADFTFNGNFTNGYSATGSFTTKNSAPPSFSEAGSGVTKFLQSLSLSVLKGMTSLDSSSTVVNGTSNDSFLRLDYNSQTNSLPALDVSTTEPNKSLYYYITNANDPSNQRVPFGSTTYNLFSFDTTKPLASGATFLGSASSIQVAAVPEPSEMFGTLVFGAIGVSCLVKRQLKKAAV